MNLHRILLISIISMIILSGFLTIVMLWSPTTIGAELFFKLILTMGILTVLAGLTLILKADLGQHKKLKDENYLD